MLNADPKILGLAFLGGIIPAFLWFWFWLKEDKMNPEPKSLLTVIFVLGMLSVFLVIPIQKFIQANLNSNNWQIISWAAVEEIVKYLVVLIIIFRTKIIDEPIDWPIFLITAALGFAAFENFLFLIKPFSLGQVTVGLMTSQLRFLGSTLLHTVTSGIIGISLGLSFYLGRFAKKIYLFIGILFAITLHSVFNFFIMDNDGSNILNVFAFLWVATVINLLLFEKLRKINKEIVINK
ncbi:MAG: PrsW family glutamic-type intramembrane protease [Patescibacteria group bacterium]